MKGRNRVRSVVVGAAITLATTLLMADAPAGRQERLVATDIGLGMDLFTSYCTPCHGATARGDGPLAASLRHRPANLTEIAKRKGGTYPHALVYRIIEGREKVAGHGSPDMPAWSDVFMRAVGVNEEAAVRRRIQALVNYLHSIQTGSTP